MTKLKVLDLFSGIGGFSLGLERTGGFETVAFCEIEEFPRRVLAKHWPEVKQYGDVRELTADVLRADGIAVDVICGGFPCQDISSAGKQAGMAEGTRSGLWSEITRLIGELRPQYVIVENVANLLSGPSDKPGGWFGRVLGDLAECGYDAEWHNIPASFLGAHHRRERIWIVAYPAGCGLQGGSVAIGGGESCSSRVHPQSSRDGYCGERGTLADAASVRCEEPQASGIAGHPKEIVNWEAVATEYGRIGSVWSAEPNVGRVANGVPDRPHRLKALGNAVVPQIPELIGHAILKARAAA